MPKRSGEIRQVAASVRAPRPGVEPAFGTQEECLFSAFHGSPRRAGPVFMLRLSLPEPTIQLLLARS